MIQLIQIGFSKPTLRVSISRYHHVKSGKGLLLMKANLFQYFSSLTLFSCPNPCCFHWLLFLIDLSKSNIVPLLQSRRNTEKNLQPFETGQRLWCNHFKVCLNFIYTFHSHLTFNWRLKISVFCKINHLK